MSLPGVAVSTRIRTYIAFAFLPLLSMRPDHFFFFVLEGDPPSSGSGGSLRFCLGSAMVMVDYDG